MCVHSAAGNLFLPPPDQAGGFLISLPTHALLHKKEGYLDGTVTDSTVYSGFPTTGCTSNEIAISGLTKKDCSSLSGQEQMYDDIRLALGMFMHPGTANAFQVLKIIHHLCRTANLFGCPIKFTIGCELQWILDVEKAPNRFPVRAPCRGPQHHLEQL